ncbi:MAG: helix-turn-helix domain-containing protein [Pseudonocardia sp.]
MGDSPITVGSWALGRQLAQYRKQAGLSGQDLAKRLKFSQPTVTRMDKGRHRWTETQLRKVCDVLGISPADAAALELARQDALQPDWRQEFPRLTDGPLGDVLGMESGAKRLRIHDGQLVPGLVQTEEFATALMTEAPYIRASEVKRRVELRMRRQEGITSGRQQLVAVLGEGAFRQGVGGPGVMRRQLAHLREQATRANVMIRALPFAAGSYAALGSSFTILDFDDTIDLPTVVCCDTLTSALIYETVETVETYTQSFGMMWPRALGETETIELLDKVESDFR